MNQLQKWNPYSKRIYFHSTSCLMPMKQSLQQDLYAKPRLKSDRSLEKCKARLVVRGDLQAEIPGEGWSLTAPFRLLRRLLAESARTARTIKQLDFIPAFVQASVKQRLFVKLPN